VSSNNVKSMSSSAILVGFYISRILLAVCDCVYNLTRCLLALHLSPLRWFHPEPLPTTTWLVLLLTALSTLSNSILQSISDSLSSLRDILCHTDNYYIYNNSSLYGVGDGGRGGSQCVTACNKFVKLILCISDFLCLAKWSRLNHSIPQSHFTIFSFLLVFISSAYLW
jgi:hypothetical protein